MLRGMLSIATLARLVPGPSRSSRALISPTVLRQMTRPREISQYEVSLTPRSTLRMAVSSSAPVECVSERVGVIRVFPRIEGTAAVTLRGGALS